MTAYERSQSVKAQARQVGFDEVGITDLTPPPHAAHLRQWLARGLAATMTYMDRQASRRLEPARILPGLTRAIVVTKNHYQDDTPPQPRRGRVARYAQGRDYHTALGGPLERLATFVRELGPSDATARWYVDAGPVPERELAQRAGIGWIGKNTMLVDPQHGSYCFLATVLTDVDLAVDAPFEADRCGTCRRCLDACPTDAFPEERVLDARRCISYLTIEHRGPVDAHLLPDVDDWIFGCDVCQDVCPWNVKFAAPAAAPELDLTTTLAWLDPQEFADMTEEQFGAAYGWTALNRPGLEGMRRNARIVAENLQRTSRA